MQHNILMMIICFSHWLLLTLFKLQAEAIYRTELLSKSVLLIADFNVEFNFNGFFK